jgi:hypothetical protein
MNRSKRKRPTLKKRKRISRKKGYKALQGVVKSIKTKKGLGGVNCNLALKNNVEGTCLEKETINLIEEEYKKDHPNDIINSSDKKEIIRNVMKKRNYKDEREVLKEIDDTTKQKQILDKNYAPNHPDSWNTNPNEWLSNKDIDVFLDDLEDRYKNFKALRTTPIDFDTVVFGQCVEIELCKFSLAKDMADGKEFFGVVFNLDEHNENGSHWVSLFISIPHKMIVFFDSALGGVPEEVNTFVKRVQKQATEKGFTMNFRTNTSEHQKGDTECGMYSIYFIIEMLIDFGNLEKFMSGNIPDNEVSKMRTQFYNRRISRR